MTELRGFTHHSRTDLWSQFHHSCVEQFRSIHQQTELRFGITDSRQGTLNSRLSSGHGCTRSQYLTWDCVDLVTPLQPVQHTLRRLQQILTLKVLRTRAIQCPVCLRDPNQKILEVFHDFVFGSIRRNPGQDNPAFIDDRSRTVQQRLTVPNLQPAGSLRIRSEEPRVLSLMAGALRYFELTTMTIAATHADRGAEVFVSQAVETGNSQCQFVAHRILEIVPRHFQKRVPVKPSLLLADQVELHVRLRPDRLDLR